MAKGKYLRKHLCFALQPRELFFLAVALKDKDRIELTVQSPWSGLHR